jgi:Tol biopolymer transport system component
MKRAVLPAAFVVLLLAGSSPAGNYSPPPGDCCPQWSPGGTQIVFEGSRGLGFSVGVVSSTALGKETFIPGIPTGVRSPDWKHVAYISYPAGDWWLTVARVDGSDERRLAKATAGFDWAPDSNRLAFGAADGTLGVVGIDGSGLKTIAAKPAGSPAWSPDNVHIAYVRNNSIHVVNADGSGDIDVTVGGTYGADQPVWSPDGKRLAYWRSDGTAVSLAVTRIGGPTVWYPIVGAVTNGAIVWAPDGRTVLGYGSAGLVAIDLRTGRSRTLTGIDNAVFSPGGGRIAYTAGGECRDRVGIYVADADGTDRRRLTNSCRIIGTNGPDVLHGDFSQVVLGLGGDDTLYADDTYYYFDGDTLYGGPGNDHLIGGFGQDILDGGPGNDTITGGGSADIITGGPGHDRLYGGGGGDTIYAKDGQRDFIDCGKNGYGKAGRDTVYADTIDVISHCEIVHRS